MSRALIQLYIFLDDTEEATLFNIKGAVRTEFPTAEAADTAAVVEMQLAILDFNGTGRTGIPADVAKTAFPGYRKGPGGEIMAKPVF